MNKIIVFDDGINPYENDVGAREILPRSEVTHQGVLYTRLSYEIPLSSAVRLLNIIQVIALAIISCFIALAFESVRTRWIEGLNGYEKVTVLIPKNDEALIEKHNFFPLLPNELVSSIFLESGIQGLGRLSAVSKEIQTRADSNQIWKKVCDNENISSFDPNYDDSLIDNYKEYYRHRLDKFRGDKRYLIIVLTGAKLQINTSPDAKGIHLKYFIKENPQFKDYPIDKMRIISAGKKVEDDQYLEANHCENQFHLIFKRG